MPSLTVSVLMAVYNTPFKLVERAVASLFRQDMEDWELIILDDGSDPELGSRLQEYRDRHPARVRYLWHPNQGQAQSINRGVQHSRGAYITVLDADDEYKPQHLSACLRQMPYTDLICSLTDTVVDCEADYYVPDRHDFARNIHVDDCTLFATFFGKRAMFEQIPFESKYAADADFYARAAERYRVEKVNLRTYIYYRNVANSVCASLKLAQVMPR